MPGYKRAHQERRQEQPLYITVYTQPSLSQPCKPGSSGTESCPAITKGAGSVLHVVALPHPFPQCHPTGQGSEGTLLARTTAMTTGNDTPPC